MKKKTFLVCLTKLSYFKYSGVQLIRPMEKPKKSGELANSGGLVASGRLAKSFEKLIFYSEKETTVYKNEL